MDWQQLLFGVFGGDMGALNVLFGLMLPFVLVAAGAKWLFDKATGK